MGIKIDILKDDAKYGKLDQVLDLLFCVSSVIFAFAIPFQFRFTPWIAHWFFAVLIFKIYYILRGKENLVSINAKDSVAILALGLYGVWALLSTSWSLKPDHTYKLAIDWLSSLLIIPGIYIFSCKRLPITLMMKSFVCGCTVLIIYTLTDLTDTALNGDVRFYFATRLEIMEHISSVSFHHIYLGFIIAVSLFISSKFLFLPKTPIAEKVFYTIHSVLALFILAIDNSRIVTLALFISVFVFFVWQIKKNKKIALTLIIIFAILTIIFIVFPTRLGETVMKIAENGDADDPRFHIWKSLYLGLKDVPFLGYGYSAVVDIYTNLFAKSGCWFALDSHYSSHNQFMESFFTLGYIGLTLIIVFLIGIVLLIFRYKSMLLTSMLILLMVSMIFEIPLCHCFAIPLLISWFIFTQSGKTDMYVTLPKYTFVLPAIVVLIFTCIIAVDSYKSVKRYASRNKIETTNYSQRKFTKKSLENKKITDENIDMIISKGESGYCTTLKDKVLEIRYFAFTNTTDTLLFTTDYYISDDFGANNLSVIARHLEGNSRFASMDLDLKERNIWKSDSLIIIPAATRSINLKTNQLDIVPSKYTSSKIEIQTCLHNAKTFSDLKGYALFRNMKIEPLYKHHEYDREK